MRKSVDILIRYEHKVREIESIMLIRLEMERRGYSVAFTANYDYKNKTRYIPKVIISPAIYWEETIINDLAIYGLKKKVANLLWEQVMGIEEEESKSSPHNIYGLGQKALALCWGEKTQDRLVKAGMPKENTKIVGQINTDLLRGRYASKLFSKEYIANKYGLNFKARWNLFISSFAYCELDIIQKGLIRDVYGDKYMEEFTECSNESRRSILRWFEEALKKFPEDIIIYRPHPDEAKKSNLLKELEEKYPNFVVIQNLSLKHWINASDKVYNWYSTGVVDAVVMNKPWRLLRPCVIPKQYDYRLFYSANQIKTVEEFVEDYQSSENKTIIDKKLFSDYYYLPSRYVYLQICDIIEDMLKSDKYDIHYSWNERIKVLWAYIKHHIKANLQWVKPFLLRVNLFNEKFAKSAAIQKALDEGFEKNVATERELQELRNLLRPLVYGE